MDFSADGKRGSQYTIYLNEGGLHHTRRVGTFHFLNLWKTKVELRIKEMKQEDVVFLFLCVIAGHMHKSQRRFDCRLVLFADVMPNTLNIHGVHCF